MLTNLRHQYRRDRMRGRDFWLVFFQSTCIQNARSFKIGALTTTIDFVQAVLEAKIYLSHKSIVDGKVAVPTAVKSVESEMFPGRSPRPSIRELQMQEKKTSSRIFQSGDEVPHNTTFHGMPFTILSEKKSSNSTLSLICNHSQPKITAATFLSMLDIGSIDLVSGGPTDSTGRPIPSPLTSSNPTEKPSFKARQKVYVDDTTLEHKALAKLLTHTLQLLFATEVLVFVEYIECIIPIGYGLYSLVLFHLPYAKYNLQFIGISASDFWMSLLTTCMYGTLEGIPMKYGLLALYQLVLVSENYWMGVRGKLLGNLVLIFNLNAVHHGVDLSFESN
uniref:Uncharacterized protein n=1 Tax=Globisporangium ultimum (strain ATCC 200006 / CBS 805.95 / DAOM BR144) TaxID=431595 RepID=K3WCR2_GLOUD